jgi:hypothetical protein
MNIGKNGLGEYRRIAAKKQATHRRRRYCSMLWQS